MCVRPHGHADIARAVAQQRKRLFRDRREYQLTLCALGQDLAGVGVDDLGDEVVLVDVHPVLRAAFIRNARPGKLRQAVNIERLDAEVLLDVLPHLFAPRLGAENTGLEVNFVL